MQGTTILICTHAPHAASAAERALRAAGSDVVVAKLEASTTALVVGGVIDLVITEAGDASVDIVGAARAAGVSAVAVARAVESAELVALVCDRELDHVVRSDDGMLSGADTRELVATAEKILRGDVFGVDKYVTGFGLEPHRRQIAGAAERDGMVGHLRDHLAELGARRRVCNALATVADELITNAIYNAPRDTDGRPRYAHRDRRDKLELESHERVELAYVCDGETVAISVTDRFGSLSAADLRRVLRRCLGQGGQIESKAGGAGIGLYTSLMACEQLVFNVIPGRAAEAIAVARLAPRGRGKGHSVHFFSEPMTEVVEAVPRRVGPSDAMRVDLRAFLAHEVDATIAAEPRRLPHGTLRDDGDFDVTSELFPELYDETEPAPVAELVAEPAPELASELGLVPPCRDRRDTEPYSPSPSTEIVHILDEIRAAGQHTRAIEIGVAYLSKRYRSVAVFETSGAGLRPWFVAGSGGLAISTMAELEGRLPELVGAGPRAVPSRRGPVIVPLCRDDEVSYVVCASGLLGDAPIDDEVLRLLQHELESALARRFRLQRHRALH
jgi:hypothetical protein